MFQDLNLSTSPGKQVSVPLTPVLVARRLDAETFTEWSTITVIPSPRWLAAIDVVEHDGVIVDEGFSTTLESMKISTSRSFLIFSKKVGRGIVYRGTKNSMDLAKK